MRKTLLAFIMLILWAGPLSAQYRPPSQELSPYEQQRYGQKLWQVPREPYQSQYRAEEYKARPYIPPQDEASAKSLNPGNRSRDRRVSGRPVQTARPRHIQEPTRTQQRFQSRKQFENDQRKISERSRVRVPGPPVTVKPSYGGSLNQQRQYFLEFQEPVRSNRTYQAGRQFEGQPAERRGRDARAGSKAATDDYAYKRPGSFDDYQASARAQKRPQTPKMKNIAAAKKEPGRVKTQARVKKNPPSAGSSINEQRQYFLEPQAADRPRIKPQKPGPLKKEKSQPGRLKAAGRVKIDAPSPGSSIIEQRQYYLVSALYSGKANENSRRAQFKKFPR